MLNLICRLSFSQGLVQFGLCPRWCSFINVPSPKCDLHIRHWLLPFYKPLPYLLCVIPSYTFVFPFPLGMQVLVVITLTLVNVSSIHGGLPYLQCFIRGATCWSSQVGNGLAMVVIQRAAPFLA